MKQLLKNVMAFYLTIGIPLVYVVGLWLVAQPNTVSFVPTFRVLSVFLAFMGIFVWITSYVSLGHKFGVLPQRQERTQRGLYKYMKHPMYLGIILTYLGLSVANQSKTGIEFTLFFLTPLLWIRAYLEERNLQ